jgi:hypothetical protein
MKQKIATLLAVVLLAAAAGCKKTAAPEDEIRAAIRAHLTHSGTLNLEAFDTDVKHVTIQGDKAEAQVEFRVKNGPGSMQLTYQMEKRNGSWTVAQSLPVGSDFTHPGLEPGQVPPTGGPDGANAPPFEALRKFKDGTNSPPKTLPPGHPPVGTPGKTPTPATP